MRVFLASILLASSLALAQTQPAIRRSTPLSNDPGMVVRQAGTVDVNCANCTTVILSDGGMPSITQGPGQDGGPWAVYVVNPSGGGSGGQVIQGVAADGGTAWSVVGAKATAAAPTYLEGDLVPLSVDLSGTLRTTAGGGGGGGVVTQGLSNDGGTLWGVQAYQAIAADGGTAWATYIESQNGPLDVSGSTVSVTGTSDVNVAQVNGNVVNTGTGASGAGTQRVVLASDQTAVPVTDNGGSLTVDGPLTDAQLRATPVPVSGTVTANAGTGPWPVTDNGGSLTVDGTVAATQSGTWNVNNVSGTVSLPTGAATSALQTTGNTSLSSIDTKTPTLGQTTMAGSVPVAIASNQSAIPVNDNGGSITVDGTVSVSGSVAVTGPLTDAQLRATPVPVSASTLPLPTGAATEATLGTRLAESTFTGRINTLGQKTMANSTPIVIASDQSAVPATQSGTWNINNVSGTVSLPTGAATETTLATRLAESTFTGRFPSVTLLGDATANPSLSSMASFPFVFNGTTWDRLRGNATDGLLVNLGANNDVVASQSGTWNITNITGTVSLPTGAATAALQTTGNLYLASLDTGLGNIDAKTPALVSGRVPVDGSGVTQPVSGTVAVTQGGTFNVNASQSGTWQTASESTLGSTVPSIGTAVGFSTGTNLQQPLVFDMDTSGGTDWVAGAAIVGGNFGTPNVANVESVRPSAGGGATGLYVYEVKKALTNPVSTAVSCSTTATALPVTTSRTTITVSNNSLLTIYIGGSAVTTANGVPLRRGESFSDEVSTSTYYCIVAAGTGDLRVLEN